MAIIMNIWVNDMDGKPIKVRFVDGVPVAEIAHDPLNEGKLFRISETEKEHYLRQLSLLQYQPSERIQL